MSMYSSKRVYHTSLIKNLISAFFLGLIVNYLLLTLLAFLSKNYSVGADQIDEIGIYYSLIFGFLGAYATLITISTHLSTDLPFNITIKYVVFSRWNLFYVFLVLLNPVLITMVHIYNWFPWLMDITPPITQVEDNFFCVYYTLSSLIYFITTFLFILYFLNQLHVEKLIKSFFEELRRRYENDFKEPDFNGLKEFYRIEEHGDKFIIVRDYLDKKRDTGINEGTESDGNLVSITPSIQRINPKPFELYFPTGKLTAASLDFLKNYSNLELTISKYNFRKPHIYLDYAIYGSHLFDDKKEEEKLKIDLEKNITYKTIDLDEFKEVYTKLKRNGNEEKIVKLVLKYISEQDTPVEKYFLYRSFEQYLKDLSEVTDWEEKLEIEISDLYKQKELFLDELSIIAELQSELLNVLFQGFEKTEKFNVRLNTGGLYLKEFLDIRYLDNFKQSQDQEWLQKHSELMSSTIGSIFGVCKIIIDSDLKQDVKKRYLKTQLGELNKCLDHYVNIHEEDFLEKYYETKFKEEKTPEEKNILKLVETKKGILEGKRRYLSLKQLELFYLILARIDSGSLNKDFFDVAMELFKIDSFKQEYYRYHFELGQLNWFNYDDFIGGAQGIEPFNFNRYRLLVSLHKSKKKEEIDIDKFEDENFYNTTHPFEKQLASLTLDFVKKYFDYDQEALKAFIKETEEKLGAKKQNIQKVKEKYLIEAQLKEEYVKKFREDCKETWQDFQNKLKKCFDLQVENGGKDIEKFFGQYVLYPKEWFLDPFEKNIALSRSSGKNFGEGQIKGKLSHILTKINNLFNEELDEDIDIINFIDDIKEKVGKGKDYCLFFSKDFDIYGLPLRKLDVSWPRDGLVTAILKLNDSVIYCCRCDLDVSLMFEAKTITLKQYSQGFEDIDEQLVIQVTPIDAKEIEKIMETNKDYHRPDDVKQMVKIRIAERYEIERKSSTPLLRLRLAVITITETGDEIAKA